MIFQLENGEHTKVLFVEDKDGVMQAFPTENANLVFSQGTKEAKEMINKILGKAVDHIDGKYRCGVCNSLVEHPCDRCLLPLIAESLKLLALA